MSIIYVISELQRRLKVIKQFLVADETREIFKKYNDISDKLESYHSRQSVAKLVSVITVPAGILVTLISNKMSIAILAILIEIVSLCFWKGVDPRSQTRDSVLEFYRKFNYKLREQEKMKLIDVDSEILGVSTELATVKLENEKSIAIYRETLEDLDFEIEILHINPVEAVFKDNNVDRRTFRNEALNESFELKYEDTLEEVRDSQEVMSPQLEEALYQLYDKYITFDLKIGRESMELTHKPLEFAKMHSLPTKEEVTNSLIIAEAFNTILAELSKNTGGKKKC